MNESFVNITPPPLLGGLLKWVFVWGGVGLIVFSSVSLHFAIMHRNKRQTSVETEMNLVEVLFFLFHYSCFSYQTL